MDNRFSIKSYRRTFAKPLRTAHGEWAVREGFLLRAESESHVGYGEIAPIPEFGTETVAKVRAVLQNWQSDAGFGRLLELMSYQCCAFGMSSALEGPRSAGAMRDYEVAALLPAGAEVLAVAAAKLARGYRTFKWKIGVELVATEQALFRELVQCLPSGARLRLDANGGLSAAELRRWIFLLKDFSSVVEYIEQPLPVGQEAVMADLAGLSTVPIALDESLNGPAGQRWFSEWKGLFVVKPALMGEVADLVDFLQPVAKRVTLSSAFETAVGVENVLCVADQLPKCSAAIGFDTLDAFTDDLSLLNPEPVLRADDRAQLDFDRIWKQLPDLT